MFRVIHWALQFTQSAQTQTKTYLHQGLPLVNGKDGVASLRDEVRRMGGTIRSYAVRIAEESFDSRIESLNEDQREIFGKGRTFRLDKNSSEFKNRLRLWNAQGRAVQGYLGSRTAPPPDDELFRSALQSEFGGDFKEGARKELNREIQNRQKQITARPTQRKSKALSSEESAVEFANKFIQEKGLDDSSGSEF